MQCLSFCAWLISLNVHKGFRPWASGKESACQNRRLRRRRCDPWVEDIPCRRKWQTHSSILAWKIHGQRSLVGYSTVRLQKSQIGLSTAHRTMSTRFMLSQMVVSLRSIIVQGAHVCVCVYMCVLLIHFLYTTKPLMDT